MESVFQEFLRFVFLSNIFLGMTLNVFIVLMNCRTWLRNKRLPPGDTIVTSLCLSRWIYQCLVAIHHFLRSFMFRADQTRFKVFMGLSRIMTNYVTIWLASLLCVYYCAKIADYKNAAFLYLKEKMASLVPWCLGLSVFLSWALSVPYVFRFISLVDVKAGNETAQIVPGTYYLGSTPPFVVFTVAFFLTVPSLWRHIRNMRGSGTGFRNPDMKTHYNAIKSMAAFFLLHIFFIVCVNYDLWNIQNNRPDVTLLMSVLSAVYPCLHSAVIIFYNSKLKRPFLVLLTCGLQFGRKD